MGERLEGTQGHDWLVDGGAVGAALRDRDWSASPLGPRETWPAALRTLLGLVLTSPSPVLLLWGRDLLAFYNDAFWSISGDGLPDALGRSVRAVWPEATAGHVSALEHVWTRGESVVREDALLELPGQLGASGVGYYTVEYRPTRDERGVICGILVSLRETTTRVGGALLQAVSDTSEDAIYAKDREGRLRFANPATLALIGKPLRDVLGKTDLEFLNDRAVAEQVMANDRRIMDAGEPEEVEELVPMPDGRPRVWLSNKVPYRDRGGRVVGLLGVSRDITERRRVVEELRASEEKFRSVLENMSEGLMLFDRDANLVYQNPASLRIHGFSPEQSQIEREALPATWDAWDEDERPIRFDEWPVSRVFRRERFQDQVLHVRRVETGQEFYASYNGSPIYGADGELAFGFITIREITEQIRAEQEEQRVQAELRRSEAELRALLEEQRRAQDKLRQADRHKNEFLAMLSHELRNPLGPIRNSVHVLERAEPGSAASVRARAVIGRQVTHMAHLIDDLLDVTRISRGKISLHRQRIDLDLLSRRTVDDHRDEYAKNGVELLVEGPGEPLWVEGDPTRLAQAVGNLLHNAAKFTPRGGHVTLTVAPDERGHAFVQVRDDGIGMAPDTLEHLFEPFVQGEQSIARPHGGLGLGLALVRGLVELHGGEVRAHSDGEGLGSELTLVLPRAPSPHAAAREEAPGSPAVRAETGAADDR